MRRLPRIPRLRAVSRPSCLQQSPVLAASARRITSTAPRQFQTAARHLDENKQKPDLLEALERDRQSALRLQEEYDAGREEVDEDAVVETSRIRIPPALTHAPVPKQARDYVPAQRAEELPEVGGVEGWWDQEGNWGEADVLDVFAREAVGDDGVKEVLLRQAVVECLAVLGKRGEDGLKGRWAVGKDGVFMAVGVEIDVGSQGDITLKGDLDAVIAGLEVTENAEAEEVMAEVEGKHSPSEASAAAEENGIDGRSRGELATAEAEVVDEQEINQSWEELTAEPAIDDTLLLPEEAREILKSQSTAWRNISLSNTKLKFAIHKRFYQLSGTYIHDAQLVLATTAEQLLVMACTPPKPKTLIDEIERRVDLLKLPNVKVFNRRVTPIDKEIWQGRWKAIEDELVERGLPVTGTGKYDKAAEGRWLIGKRTRGRHF